MQDETDNAPIDLFAQRLRRNAILSRPQPPNAQRRVNWLDKASSRIIEIFDVRLPALRQVYRGELSYDIASLRGTTSNFVASPQFFSWSAITAPPSSPQRPRPQLQLMTQDPDRPRTENRGDLRLV